MDQHAHFGSDLAQSFSFFQVSAAFYNLMNVVNLLILLGFGSSFFVGSCLASNRIGSTQNFI